MSAGSFCPTPGGSGPALFNWFYSSGGLVTNCTACPVGKTFCCGCIVIRYSHSYQGRGALQTLTRAGHVPLVISVSIQLLGLKVVHLATGPKTALLLRVRFVQQVSPAAYHRAFRSLVLPVCPTHLMMSSHLLIRFRHQELIRCRAQPTVLHVRPGTRA